MSQVKLTLRPPPNVDFVHGYPGIPPGTDRPQASVKGAIEVRTGPQGVKAKWVRVELRKVEILPGGGLSNTFYDFVGPSPVTLWSASDEYGLLRSQDFPFQIRIPESVPPSLALESGAGIKYELLASVCTKGKRGFLRRRKSSVISTQASIIIDKHELHSTWPIYSQPETRQITQDGVTLSVDRNNACFGPGDRISVMATLRSDSTNSVLLRGFELTLKESTIFRAGPYTSGKKSVPQVRVATIDENKVPVNFNLYGGMVQKAELTCGVSPNHTTTSLNTARHIDITYVLSVKALLGTGPLVMELPVVLSNWQRAVSHEAVRRIGPVPSLAPTAPAGVSQSTVDQRPSTAGGNANEIGRLAPLQDRSGVPIRTTSASASVANTSSNPYSTPDTDGTSPVTSRPSQTATGSSPGRIWPSAEEEKLKLYEGAKAKAERIQGQAIGSSTAGKPQESASPNVSAASPKRNGPWPTAEEEKLKLWNRAQAAVNRTQAEAFTATEQHRTSPPPGNKSSNAGGSGSKSYLSAEQEKEALRRYNDAKEAVDRTQNTPVTAGGSSSAPVTHSPPPVADMPPPFEASGPPVDARAQLAEKERLRRHFEAQDAAALAPSQTSSSPQVDARQQLAEKERLRRHFEAQDTGASSPSPPAAPAGDARAQLAEKERLRRHFEAQDAAAQRQSPPPALDARAQLAEKERLRRHYEAQDAAAQQPADDPPPFPGGDNSIQTAIQEKEMLRRKFAMQDAQMASRNQPSPPRAASPTYRPTPSPPAPGGSSSKPMTAAEEKAMLRARYEAENAVQPPPRSNGINGSSPTSPPPAPPPLMPRPPADYIRETQEEDARVSKYALNGAVPNFDDLPSPPPRPYNI